MNLNNFSKECIILCLACTKISFPGGNLLQPSWDYSRWSPSRRFSLARTLLCRSRFPCSGLRVELLGSSSTCQHSHNSSQGWVAIQVASPRRGVYLHSPSNRRRNLDSVSKGELRKLSSRNLGLVEPGIILSCWPLHPLLAPSDEASYSMESRIYALSKDCEVLRLCS